MNHIQLSFLKEHLMISFRITFKDLSLETTYNYLINHYPYVLVSEEGLSTKLHHHGIVCMAHTDKSIRSVKDTLRQHLKTCYKELYGNQSIYIRESENKKQLLKYTLKEGSYLYKGFSSSLIEIYETLSTKKENIKQKIIDNEENLITHSINFEQFGIRYLEIQVTHGNNIYNHQIKAYLNRFQLLSGDISYDEYFSNNFLRY